jgi:hypothetical protein
MAAPEGDYSKEVMADDELDEEFDPEAIEEDIDEDALEDDPLETELEDDDTLTVVVEEDAVVVEEEEVVEEPAARTKKRREDDEEDDDELDPDDVEADLDTILKDRIAAIEEDDDDDLDEEVPKAAVESPDGVIPKRANEFMCTGCFLLVNRGQFGVQDDLQCPVGESDCPAIDQIRRESAAAPAKPVAKAAKAARKR